MRAGFIETELACVYHSPIHRNIAIEILDTVGLEPIEDRVPELLLELGQAATRHRDDVSALVSVGVGELDTQDHGKFATLEPGEDDSLVSADRIEDVL